MRKNGGQEGWRKGDEKQWRGRMEGRSDERMRRERIRIEKWREGVQ